MRSPCISHMQPPACTDTAHAAPFLRTCNLASRRRPTCVTDRSWAGARHEWGSNVMATALHNNLFDVLGRYGGYDLFVLQVTAPTATLTDRAFASSDRVSSLSVPLRLAARPAARQGDR